MKLSVDASLCTGHGQCYRMAQGLLSDDDEGFVSIRGASIDVPADQREFADLAMASCPEQAITLTDD